MATTLRGLSETQERTGKWSGAGLPDADQEQKNLDLLEKRRQDVVSSAIDVRRAFFIFGAFSLYLIITVGSTTHLQLLTGTVFKLPILSVDIPILGFYTVLPLLYLLAHVNLMGEINALSEDVARLKQHLTDAGLQLFEKIPFGPARTLIQPDDSSSPRALINFVTSMAIAILPPLILLLVQIRFLPYHSEPATWLHRFIILTDIVLVFCLWFPLKVAYSERLQLISDKLQSSRRRKLAQLRSASSISLQWAGLGLSGLVMILILIVSFVWITVPDSSWEEYLVDTSDQHGLDVKTIGGDLSNTERGDVPDRTYHGVTPAQRQMLALTYHLFEAPGSWHWMRRNLIVSHKDLVAMRPSDEVLFFLDDADAANEEREQREKEVWERGSRGLDLRGRNLRYGVFSHSDLHKADLRGADLRGTVFFKTKLRYANLGDIPRAELGRCADEPLFSIWNDAITSNLIETKTIDNEGIRFCRANLRYAVLRETKLQHARLWEADLTKSDMRWADLQQVDLNNTTLQFANLMGVNLQEAELKGADLRGAILTDAKLHDVKLNDSTLLTGANLKGAMLGQEQLQRQLAECQVTLPEVPNEDDVKEEASGIVKIDTNSCHHRYLQ